MIDYTGQRFGMLTVTMRSEYRRKESPSGFALATAEIYALFAVFTCEPEIRKAAAASVRRHIN